MRDDAEADTHALTTPLITKADGTKFGKTESGTIWLDPQPHARNAQRLLAAQLTALVHGPHEAAARNWPARRYSATGSCASWTSARWTLPWRKRLLERCSWLTDPRSSIYWWPAAWPPGRAQRVERFGKAVRRVQ